MKTESMFNERVALAALMNRNRDFLEIRGRSAAQGSESRCAFSGRGRCATPDRSHSCLDGLRARYALSVRTIREMRKSSPGLFETEEAKALERAFRKQKVDGKSVAKTS